MESGLSPHQRWLAAEHNDQDEAAVAAFARAFAELPRVEASADFTVRTVQAVWRARARRRLAARLGRVAAVLLTTAAGLAVAYASIVVAVGAAVRGAVLFSQVFVWLIVSIDEGVTWWSIAQHAATGISHALTTPSNATALVAIEIVGALAIYGFLWLLRQERGAYDPQKGQV